MPSASPVSASEGSLPSCALAAWAAFPVTNRLGLFRGRRSDEPARGFDHSALLAGRDVIVAEQMEQAVGEQKSELGDQVPLSPAGLAERRIERDHDIAEHPARALVCALVHWKREYVGRAILPTVLAIERPNSLIVRQEHAELGLRELERAEHSVGHLPDQPGRQGARTGGAAQYRGGHRGSVYAPWLSKEPGGSYVP